MDMGRQIETRLENERRKRLRKDREARMRSGSIAVPERVKIAFAMIEKAANDRTECPSNAELATMIGAGSTSAGADVVATLEALGMISVRRGRAARVITITATGKSTSGTIPDPIKTVSRSNEGWTPERDAVLMEAVAQGLDFEQAAHWVGFDAEQCAARFDELAAQMGPQAA
jgi:hypothetical protein